MRILVLSNHYNTLRIFRRELLIKLAKTNEVIVSMPECEEENKKIFEDYGCKVVFTEMERRGMNPIKDISLLKRYKKLVKEVKPEKVITYTIKCNIYGALACKSCKIEHYCNVTGLGSAFMADGGLMRKLVSTMYKYSMNKAGKVFFENVGNRDTLVNSKVVKAEQAVVMAGAGVNVDEFEFKDYPADDGYTHFLNVGRIMKEKGMDELFYAIKKVRKDYPNTTFDFIGWYEDNYKEQVEQMQSEGLICFHGFQANVKPFIENANVIVHPSYHEGMSNTLLESCSMGRPIITSNIHGCLEAVEDGKNGYLCNVRDGEDLYEKMKKFIELSYDEKKLMGHYARDFVVKNFNKVDVVNKTIEEIGL